MVAISLHTESQEDFVKRIQAAERTRLITLVENYIEKNRYKIERLDRYVLDDILTAIKGEEKPV